MLSIDSLFRSFLCTYLVISSYDGYCLQWKRNLRGLIVSCHIHLPHAGDESLGSLPPHSPSTPPILTSPTSVRQLEALVRVHVMMVEVCGRGAPQHQTHCLSALGYCCHIWKVSLERYLKDSV